MRIKRLKANNWYDLKEMEISFQEEQIILVRQPNDEGSFIPFSADFLDLTRFLFFNDSYMYAKNAMQKNTLIECTVGKDSVEYTFGLKGACSEIRQDGYVRMQNVLDWFCIIPEKQLQGKKGGWLGAQLCCDSQEYFYPYALEDFSKFNRDTYADSPLLYGDEFGRLQSKVRWDKIKVDLETELKELVDNFKEIKIDEHFSVGLDENKEYVLFFDGEVIPEEMRSEKEELFVNFCGWINNLHIIKRLCALAKEDGNLPVFIDAVFDDILAEYKDVFIEKLRETGRQVFIVSRKHDEELEKLCDKVVRVGIV